MFEAIKKKIALYIVNQKLRHNKTESISFKNLLQNSFRFFIIMPWNESNFHKAEVVLKFFEGKKKEVIVFTRDYRINLLPQKFRAGAVDFSISDISKLYLPSGSLEKKLKKLKFDVVIDLEKEENLFNSYAACLIEAPVRIGFRKDNSDKYYSLQIDNTEDNPELFYKILLNCLQMF